MLTLTDIRKSFGTVVAVDGVSLSVRPGEIFGFLGPNGAGKTTSLSIAIGLLKPDSGVVRVGEGADAADPARPEARRQIGLAPQSLALYDELSAEENLAFFGALYGLTRAEQRRRTDELLGLVGLTDRRRGRAKTFSGGMKRRLNMAAALMHDPQLVLLDEPTAGVDPQSRNAILALVRELREQGRTIIYTTHYMEEAQKICDRVAIIDHGRILAMGPVDDLIATHGGRHTVVTRTHSGEERETTDAPLAVLAERIARPDTLAIRVDRPDLEAVFLALTGRSLRD